MCLAGVNSIEHFRGTKFQYYVESVSAKPPPCMAGFARMLHAGPVTSLYENSKGDGQMFPM